MITDPIADMLTRLRNANQAFHERVDIPFSKIKGEIARILKQEGFIKSYRVIPDRKQGILRISLRHGPNKTRAINGLRRVSKSGRRVYVKKEEVPNVMGSYGIAILSTSQGLMTNFECRKKGLGGELLCLVW